jgi:hypothetical protein
MILSIQGFDFPQLKPPVIVKTISVFEHCFRHGGYITTFAQKDTAFKFTAWISAELKLYIIKDMGIWPFTPILAQSKKVLQLSFCVIF